LVAFELGPTAFVAGRFRLCSSLIDEGIWGRVGHDGLMGLEGIENRLLISFRNGGRTRHHETMTPVQLRFLETSLDV